MGQPLALSPGDLIAFNSEFLAATNFQVSDDGGFVKVGIFFKDELE
jgi:hypothetical protein